jgi:hypothetical protein
LFFPSTNTRKLAAFHLTGGEKMWALKKMAGDRREMFPRLRGGAT